MKKAKMQVMAMAATVIAAAMIGGATPAVAQDAALGKSIWINKVNCRDCHGWAGDGVPDDPQALKGPNLRESYLDAEGVAEVMRCGRPGTPMPYFRRTAWNPGEANCYGVTREDLGDDVPQRGIAALTEREISAITALIMETFIGKGPPTFEECIAFWGVGATTCPRYPRAE